MWREAVDAWGVKPHTPIGQECLARPDMGTPLWRPAAHAGFATRTVAWTTPCTRPCLRDYGRKWTSTISLCVPSSHRVVTADIHAFGP